MKKLTLLLVGLILLTLVVACGDPTATQPLAVKPTLNPNPTHAATTLPIATTPASKTSAQVATEVRATANGIKPLLLPTKIGPNYEAILGGVAKDSFDIKYFDSTTGKQFRLMVMVPNPPPGGPNSQQSQLEFRGIKATYQINDTTKPDSQRWLYWEEPGQWEFGNLNYVIYYLTAEGLSEAEFWEIANSLQANPGLAPRLALPQTDLGLAKPPGLVSKIPDGISWSRSDQNTGKNIPLAATNSAGTLWVRFPTFSANGYNPDGGYNLIFNSASGINKNIPEGAQILLTLPGSMPNSRAMRYITELNAVGGERFLLTTLLTEPSAQNGGKVEFWWLEPRTKAAQMVLSGPQTGGGHFSTLAHNERWLFWNQAELVPPALTEIGNTRSFLLNLETGKVKEISLGGKNWTQEARWENDGKLYFKPAGETIEKTLDPLTGRVS